MSESATNLPLAERVGRRLDELARRMVATFVTDIPLYAHLPRDLLEGEVLDVCRRNLGLFIDCLLEARRPAPQELVEIRASAARRAEERVPLGALLTAYHVGGRIGWDALREEARPEERDQLADTAGLVIAYLESVTSAVASAYLEEQQSIYGEERDARRSLVEALLAGTPAEGAAGRAGMRLASGYHVIAVRAGPSEDERDTGVMAAVAGRRKARRLEEAFAARGGPDTLIVLDSTGGTVLLPASSPETAPLDGPEFVAELTAVSGAELWLGMAWGRAPDGVRGAGDEAREVLRLAVDLDRAPGAYRLDDVLLEYLLTRPPEATRRLASLLDPLDAGPDLLATLECWFAEDFDRRRTAAALHVHPNTLDYRLRRITELTGLDASSARGLQLLGAALTAQRLQAPNG